LEILAALFIIMILVLEQLWLVV